MTILIEGMIPAEFLTALNDNFFELYGTDNFTTVTNIGGTDLETLLNTNFSKSDNLVGIRGSSFADTINNNFSTIFIEIFSKAFINTLSDYAIGIINMPSAIYYNGKTYIVIQSYDDNPYILTYTHSIKQWSAPVKIGDQPSKHDAHGQPAILIDNLDYIHIIWSGHGANLLYAKSDNPEDISTWTAQTSPAIGTYPQWFQFSNNDIYLFYRNLAGSYWDLKISNNNGTTWGDATHILDTDIAYANFVKGIGDIIHCVCFTHPGTTEITRKNVYYFIYNSGWKNILGNSINLPVTSASSDILVYDSGVKYTPDASLDFDASNNPYIIFTEGVDIDGVYSYKFAKYNGTTWDVYSLGVSTDYWRDFATAIDYVSANQIDAYVVTEGTFQTLGGNIELWRSVNGGSLWSKISTLIEGQFIDPCLVRNYNSEGKIVLCEIKGENKWNNRGCLWGDSGFVSKRIDN